MIVALLVGLAIGLAFGFIARDLLTIRENLAEYEEGRAAGWAEAVGRETT